MQQFQTNLGIALKNPFVATYRSQKEWSAYCPGATCIHGPNHELVHRGSRNSSRRPRNLTIRSEISFRQEAGREKPGQQE